MDQREYGRDREREMFRDRLPLDYDRDRLERERYLRDDRCGSLHKSLCYCMFSSFSLYWLFLLSLGHPQAHLVLLIGIERGIRENTRAAPAETGSHITAQATNDLHMKEVLSVMITGLQLTEVRTGGFVYKL